MIKWFLNWLSGGALNIVGDQLNKAYDRKLTAENDHERLEADKEIAYLQAKRDVLLAEASNPITAWVRPAFALPFVLYNAKLVVWDKVLGLGTTDPLSPELVQIELAVIGFYFFGRSAEKIAAKFFK